MGLFSPFIRTTDSGAFLGFKIDGGRPVAGCLAAAQRYWRQMTM